MKTLFRAFVVAAFAASVVMRGVAQDTPPPAAAPVETPPAATPPVETKGARPQKPAAVRRAPAQPAPSTTESKADPVFHPEPGIAKQNNVNVRGQAAINSEVVTHLQKNQPITLLEEITLKKAKQDEPSRWYRIALPPNVGVWVHSSYVDADTKTVKPRRLNVRSGPGENYSILGRLEQGAAVNQLEAKGVWLKISPPTNSYGFVAAHLVEKAPEAPAIVAAPPVTPPPVTPTPEPPPVTPPVVAEVVPTTPEIPPAAPVTPPVTETPPATTPPPVSVVPAPAEVLPDTPIEKVKKIVSREGVLKGSVSIQAPSHFELRSLDTGRSINYVFSPSTNLLLRQFKGKRIMVSGEEYLDERWQNTPVIIVDSLEVVP